MAMELISGIGPSYAMPLFAALLRPLFWCVKQCFAQNNGTSTYALAAAWMNYILTFCNFTFFKAFVCYKVGFKSGILYGGTLI